MTDNQRNDQLIESSETIERHETIEIVEMKEKTSEIKELNQFKETEEMIQIKHDLKRHFGEGPYEIMIAGTFDIIHPGHIHYIQEAAQYGKVTVIIARDQTVQRVKHRQTVLDENIRSTIVYSIKGVDRVLLGNENGIWYEPVLRENPHLFLMGCNQPGDIKRFEKTIQDNGGRTLFRRSSSMESSFSLKSSSEIRRRVIEMFGNE